MPATPETTRCAVLYETKNLRLEEHPIPPLGCKDLLIAVHFVGICGADVHIWSFGKYASFGLQVETGKVIGHEASGVVMATGPNVSQDSFQKGDRVVIEPARPCLECTNCRNGKSNICLTTKPWNQPLYGGFLSQYIVVPSEYVHKLPLGIGTDEGALIEQFSFALCACEKSKLNSRHKLLILGSGPLGLQCLMAARAKGVRDILVTDLLDYRLEAAKALGARDGLKTEGVNSNMAAVSKQIIEKFGGESPDVVFECSANRFCQQLAIHVTIPGGSCVFLGEDEADINISLGKWASKDLRVHAIGTVDRRFFREAIICATGSRDVQFSRLISQRHVYCLAKANDAFKAASSRQDGVLKVLIRCTET